MSELKNSDVLGTILRSVHVVAGRRTTQSFAAKVIGSIVKTLEQSYEFLKYVKVHEIDYSGKGNVVDIAPEIDSIDSVEVGKAIEAIVRVVYMDIIGKGGLFFIKELKNHAGEGVIEELKNYGVDLALLQIEQHYLYRKRLRKKAMAQSSVSAKASNEKPPTGVSLLGYTWNNVSTWRYDPAQKVCTLYSDDGEVLDQLNVDAIIENYVKNLSESFEEIPAEYEEKVQLNEKEFELLKLLHSRDMDVETAVGLLHISKEEFDAIVRRLLGVEMLQYTSFNEIELTEIGLSYISKREKEPEKNKPVSEKNGGVGIP